MQIFKTIIFSFSFSILIVSFINLFLEHTPLIYTTSEIKTNYFHIHLENNFFHNKPTKKNSIYRLNFTLKGIYKNKNNGFIIIEDKNKKYFINLNEKFKGFKLIDIKLDKAIFKKDNKIYILSFKKLKNINSKTTENKLYIPKNKLLEYKNNFQRIWENISLIRTKEGYKITYVRKNSFFDKLNLKVGDIILEINGKKLNDDKQAWELYKQINSLNQLEVIVKRNNQIKVLNYEIN